MGNDYPSAGPITAGSLGQKQARMKERTEASYPASNHLLALRARGLSIFPPPLRHGLVSLVHKKNVITDGALIHTNVMEDSVGPAEVIYGSEHKHFLDILFIHLNLFNNNPRHFLLRGKVLSGVYTTDVWYIYRSTHMNKNVKQGREHKTKGHFKQK